jgi:hypothetical protein
MAVLVKNINPVLEQKIGPNQGLNSFTEKYRTTFYNASALDQVDEFLLGESHFGKRSDPLNGTLISSIASKFPVILFLEGYACMQEILDESKIQKIMFRFCISQDVRKNIRFIGWDARRKMQKCNELHRQLCQSKDLIKRHERTLLSAKNPLLLMDLAIREKVKEVLKELKLEQQKVQDLRVRLEAEMIKSFPFRTKNMVSSLQRIKELIPEQSPCERVIAIWICGSSHLKESKKEKAFNLDSLRMELENHKAVLMIPNKQDKGEEFSLDEKISREATGIMTACYHS